VEFARSLADTKCAYTDFTDKMFARQPMLGSSDPAREACFIGLYRPPIFLVFQELPSAELAA
jgi:hypothetical protein